jgi:charged multivesicular body protein 2A
MAFLFGRCQQPTTRTDSTRDYTREIRKAVNRLAGEDLRMDREEKTCVATMRRAAKHADTATTTNSARDLVRIRARRKENHNMQEKFNSMGRHANSIQHTHTMTGSMSKLTVAMHSMNSQTNLRDISRIVENFERESEVTADKQETMEEAISAMSVTENEEDLVNAEIFLVLEEFGVEIPNVPRTRTREEISEDERLQERLEKLKS